MKRRLFSLLIALSILISLFPAMALADEPAWIEADSSTALTEALSSGGNIRVTAPIEVTAAETLEITKAVVLDLNSQTVTWNSSAKEAIKIQTGGALTIQDASDVGMLDFISTYSSTSNYGIAVYKDGSLTLTGGTVSYRHASKSGGAIYTNINAAFTMTGGTVKISGASCYAMYLCSSTLHQITGGKLAFDPDTAASTVYGIYTFGSNVEITDLIVDGSNIPDTKAVVCVRGYNSSTPISISGGSYTANKNKSSYAVGAGSGNKTSISGGTFTGEVKAAVGKITGGAFSIQPSASYLALGKIFELQSDSYYHVVDGSYVAYIGDVGYLTWDALFADASTTSSPSKIYLLSDAGEITVPEGKNVTFYNSKNLSVERIVNNGTCKVLTYALSGTEIVNNGTLSLDHEVGSLINNASGVVNATANSPKITGSITNHGTMTISKGTYLGSITTDGTLAITGGTFSQDVKELCAEGYTTQQNKEGTWDVVADVPHVAEINGYWYGTLQAALSAAKSGDTVKLLSDITLSTKVSISNKTLTLDMNGHKITYGASGKNFGVLVFLGASDITITGNGSFDFDETYSADTSESEGRIFNVNNSSVLTIENGTFYAGVTCILADNNAKAIILGGTYSASQSYDGNWFLLNLQDKAEAQITVYGGTFAEYDPSQSHTEPGGPVSFCAEGYTVTSEEKEGITYYTVAPESTQTFVAQIGGQKFISLASAVSAAQSGDTIELLEDIDLTECLELGKSISIQGNDHTITNTANRIIRLTQPDLDVKIYNCDLISTSAASSDVRGISFDDVASDCSLLLDGCSLSAAFYAINIIPGSTHVSVTIKNGSVAAGWAAINSYSNDSTFTIENSQLTGINDKGESSWNNFATIVFDGYGLNTHDNIGKYGSNNTVHITNSTVMASTESSNAQDWLSLQYGATGNQIYVDPESHIVDDAGNNVSEAVYISFRTGSSGNPGQTYNPNHLISVQKTAESYCIWAPANDAITLPAAPSKAGYTFAGWSDGTAVYPAAGTYTMPEDGVVTLTAQWSAVSSGSGSSSGNKTETVTNPDGSTTTTVTRPDGSTTETTKYPDGSKEVVDTKKDGTITTTTTDKAGNETKVVENTDGSSKTTVTNKDGSSSTTTVSKDDVVESQVKLPASVVDNAADQGEVISLPIPEVPVTTDEEHAPTITVDLPSDTDVTVEIPVENVTAGTVAVRMHANGSQEVIMDSVTTESGVIVTLHDGDTVKILDNSVEFMDVSDSHWASDAIDFVVSRELFNGTSATTFSPAGDMTRAMVLTVLARYEGVDTTTGDTWYEAGIAWAVENGISDGTNPMNAVTREQLALMLYRYSNASKTDGTLSGFADASSVSDWAFDAMVWAVENGLINGVNGNLNPQGTASRAEVAAMFMRFIAYQNK